MKRYVRCLWVIPLLFFFIMGMGGPAQPKAAAAHHSQDLFLFDFGKGPAEKDYVKVNESSVYQNGAGYGFSQAGSAVCKKTQKRSAQKRLLYREPDGFSGRSLPRQIPRDRFCIIQR